MRPACTAIEMALDSTTALRYLVAHAARLITEGVQAVVPARPRRGVRGLRDGGKGRPDAPLHVHTAAGQHNSTAHAVARLRCGSGRQRPGGMTDEQLIAEIEAQRSLMIAVATGGPLIERSTPST